MGTNMTEALERIIEVTGINEMATIRKAIEYCKKTTGKPTAHIDHIVNVLLEGNYDEENSTLANDSTLKNSSTVTYGGMVGGRISKEDLEISKVLEQSLSTPNQNETKVDHMGDKFWYLHSQNPHERKRDMNIPTGIANVGCTCWFSAVIQSLFWIPSFRNIVLDFDQSKEPLNESINFKLLVEMRKLFALLMHTKRKYVDPTNVVNIFKNILGNQNLDSLDLNKQQDVSEFLHKLLDMIEEALKTQISSEDKNTHNKIQETFYGKIVKESSSSNKTSKKDVEVIGQLPLSIDGLSNLHEAIERTLSGDSTNERESWFQELPQVLTLELLRFKYNIKEMTTEKINDPIEFSNVIYMDRYMESNLDDIRMKRKRGYKIKKELLILKRKLNRYIIYNSSVPNVSLVQILRLTRQFIEDAIPNISENPINANILNISSQQFPPPESIKLDESILLEKIDETQIVDKDILAENRYISELIGSNTIDRNVIEDNIYTSESNFLQENYDGLSEKLEGLSIAEEVVVLDSTNRYLEKINNINEEFSNNIDNCKKNINQILDMETISNGTFSIKQINMQSNSTTDEFVSHINEDVNLSIKTDQFILSELHETADQEIKLLQKDSNSENIYMLEKADKNKDLHVDRDMSNSLLCDNEQLPRELNSMEINPAELNSDTVETIVVRPNYITYQEFNVLQKCLSRWEFEVNTEIQNLKKEIEKKEKIIESLYCDNHLMKYPYRLHAILVHEGAVSLGHYWAYVCTNPASNIWHKFNDVNVTKATEAELLKDGTGSQQGSSNAYCFVYVNERNPQLFDASFKNMPMDIKDYVDNDNAIFTKELTDWDGKQTKSSTCAAQAVDHSNYNDETDEKNENYNLNIEINENTKIGLIACKVIQYETLNMRHAYLSIQSMQSIVDKISNHPDFNEDTLENIIIETFKEIINSKKKKVPTATLR